MANEDLRSVLDGLDEEELRALEKEVRDSQDGSMHEIEGVQTTKEQAILLINQALPAKGS